MNSQKNVSNKLLKLLDKLMQNKIYGSIEVYFEAGEVTQVTQRIINKISRANKKPFVKKTVTGGSSQISRTEFSETVTEI